MIDKVLSCNMGVCLIEGIILLTSAKNPTSKFTSLDDVPENSTFKLI